MKTTISILNWINRILMVPFAIILLTLIIEINFAFYAMYMAFAVGCFQVLSFLIVVFFFKRISSKLRKYVLIYAVTVISYFLVVYILDHFKINNMNDYVIFLLFSFPVVVSLFWTFILESLNKII